MINILTKTENKITDAQASLPALSNGNPVPHLPQRKILWTDKHDAAEEAPGNYTDPCPLIPPPRDDHCQAFSVYPPRQVSKGWLFTARNSKTYLQVSKLFYKWHHTAHVYFLPKDIFAKAACFKRLLVLIRTVFLCEFELLNSIWPQFFDSSVEGHCFLGGELTRKNAPVWNLRSKSENQMTPRYSLALVSTSMGHLSHHVISCLNFSLQKCAKWFPWDQENTPVQCFHGRLLWCFQKDWILLGYQASALGLLFCWGLWLNFCGSLQVRVTVISV